MAFIPGLELSRRFYWEAVRPVLEGSFGGLRHSAALIGPGSETLGFDDEMSTDHGWGPRLQLFLQFGNARGLARPDSWETHAEDVPKIIDTALREELPHSFLGLRPNGTRRISVNRTMMTMGSSCWRPRNSGPVNHRVETQTISACFSAGT